MPNDDPARSGRPDHARQRIAFAMSDLKGGGVQLVSIIMAAELIKRGYAVDFVVDDPSGALRQRVPPGVRIREQRPVRRE